MSDHDSRLLDLLYGELPPDEARALEAEIAGDASASELLAGWQAVRSAVTDLPVPEPDPQVHYTVLRAAREAVAPAQPTGFWAWLSRLAVSPAFAGVAVLCLAVGGVYFMQLKSDDSSARFDEIASASSSASDAPAPTTKPKPLAATQEKAGDPADGAKADRAKVLDEEIVGNRVEAPRAAEALPKTADEGQDGDTFSGVVAPGTKAAKDIDQAADMRAVELKDAIKRKGAMDRKRARPKAARRATRARAKKRRATERSRIENKKRAPIAEEPTVAKKPPAPVAKESERRAAESFESRKNEEVAFAPPPPAEAAPQPAQVPVPVQPAKAPSAQPVADTGVAVDEEEERFAEGAARDTVAKAPPAPPMADSAEAEQADKAPEVARNARPARARTAAAAPDVGRAARGGPVPQTVGGMTGGGVAEKLDGDLAEDDALIQANQPTVPPDLQAARAARSRGDHRSAVSAYARYFSRHVGHPQFNRSLFEAAASHAALGQIDEAIRLYGRIPASAGALHVQAQGRIAALRASQRATGADADTNDNSAGRVRPMPMPPPVDPPLR